MAASGIRTLAGVKYDGMNLVIVAASLAFGCLPIVSEGIYNNFPNWFATIFSSGISSGALMAVLLNILFNEIKFGTPGKDASVFAAAPPRIVKREQICGLLEGDQYQDGKLIDGEGKEVLVVSEEEFEQIQTGQIDLADLPPYRQGEQPS